MRRPRHAQEPAPGTRPPEYVIELWVSNQIKDRIRRAHATPATSAVPAPEPPPARAPEQELEAEP